ncbi:MAG: hypothetical protein E7184_02130 [Erysipelotrichaceae bacterium]|nr:hypothetical protein [Erysipelotrichaceae bacterium]
MKKFYDRYQISFFGELHLLDRLRISNIPFSNFHKIDDYTYIFESSFLNRKKIKKLFPSSKIIKSRGFLSFFRFLIIEKVTLISIIISSCFFIFLSSKIWDIKVKGNYQEINNSIIKELKTYNLKKGVLKPSFNYLKETENKVYNSLEEDIEWLELSLSGSVLYVNYVKRRTAPNIKETKGKLYASKDGVISKINILKGNVLVKENQFVRKGELLVDDILVNTNNEEIYLGTSGEVFAYTWYIVEVNYQTKLEDSLDIFNEARDQSLEKIRLELSPNERIIKENVLHYNVNDNIISIKIHFTLYESIGEEI